MSTLKMSFYYESIEFSLLWLLSEIFDPKIREATLL